jgi:hypothetical protein
MKYPEKQWISNSKYAVQCQDLNLGGGRYGEFRDSKIARDRQMWKKISM